MRVKMIQTVSIKGSKGSETIYGKGQTFNVDDSLAKEWINASPPAAHEDGKPLPDPKKVVPKKPPPDLKTSGTPEPISKTKTDEKEK